MKTEVNPQDTNSPMLVVTLTKTFDESKLNRTLLTQALIKFLAGIILTGLLVFLPAGSFAYWQGWLLMGVLFVPMFIAGIFIFVKNPELLRKRLNAKEKESEQKAVVALSGLLFLISFVTAGLNWRFNWWMLPDLAVWTATGLFILSYILYAEVLRETVLAADLHGYKEYQARVNYKLIPFIW